MTLSDIAREVAALPTLLVEGEENGDAPATAPIAAPLAALSRQGRLLLRLTASTDALAQKSDALVQTGQKAVHAAQAAADDRLFRMANEAVFLMDVLQNAHEAAAVRANENNALANELASALRSGARRLAAQGVCEIPCPVGEPPDGLLHESVDTVEAGSDGTQSVTRYGVVGVVRRGWQIGNHVLRRAQVVTAR